MLDASKTKKPGFSVLEGTLLPKIKGTLFEKLAES